MPTQYSHPTIEMTNSTSMGLLGYSLSLQGSGVVVEVNKATVNPSATKNDERLNRWISDHDSRNKLERYGTKSARK